MILDKYIFYNILNIYDLKNVSLVSKEWYHIYCKH